MNKWATFEPAVSRICRCGIFSGQALDTVSSFRYLRAILSDEGSKREVLPRIAQTTTALAKLKAIWKYKNIRLPLKGETSSLTCSFNLTLCL